MVEEPKVPDKSKKISEDDNSSRVDENDKPSQKKGIRRFRDFLAGGDIGHSESSSEKAQDNSKKSSEKVEGENKEDKTGSDDHELHISKELMKFDIYRKLRSNKQKVVKVTGGLIGVLFIISGILYLLGSSVRVADNVVFGERAGIAAFLVLIGVLILAAVFARSLLQGSFLKHIHNELEEAEDHPSSDKSSDTTSHKNEKQKGNIDEKDKK